MTPIRVLLVAAWLVVLPGFGHGQEDPAAAIAAANVEVAQLYRAGDYPAALERAREVLEDAERVLGPEHPDTLSSVNNLASLHQIQGRYGEAELLYRRALEARARVLGPEHPQTLGSVNNLAGLYQAQGRYGEAEPLLRRALEASECVLGPEHPDTLISVNNLAGLYASQGRYGAAEPLFRQALEASERVFGPDHPRTLTGVNNLAGLYDSQGRYGAAEPLYRRALEARERVLGPEHPDTLVSVNNLAELYKSQGRYGAAEPLHRRALEAHERVLGPEHPDTLISVNNLALLYQSRGRYGAAEPLHRRALEAHERVLGPEHPDTLLSINNLAELYRTQGRYGAAEPLHRRALEARERVLGPEHPHTIASVNNLAGLYESQGRYGEAEPLYRRALEASEGVLGPERPHTIGVHGNLAALLAAYGREREALRAFKALDQRLARWLGAEVRTTRAATLKRQALRLNSGYQDAGLSLALAHPSTASAGFAADLLLRWKKRLAQDDAVLNNMARESRDPALREAVDRVRTRRAALSNLAFDPGVDAAAKQAAVQALEAAEAELRATSSIYARFLETHSARADEVQIELPRDGALVELRFFRPSDFDEGSLGPRRLLAVVLTPDGAPILVDLGEADLFQALQAQAVDQQVRADIGVSFARVMEVGHDALVAPLLPHLDGVATLFIAPDGPLHALPFEALVDGDGRRLVERFHVRLPQTGRDLVARDRPATGTGLVAVGGVAFGPPPGADEPRVETDEASAAPVSAAPVPADGPADDPALAEVLRATRSQVAGFAPLPQSRVEAETIGRLYGTLRPDEPAPRVLTGADATEAALKALPAPPRVLHLATPRLLSRDRHDRGPAALAVRRHAGRRQPGAGGRDRRRRRERHPARGRGADAEPVRHRAGRAVGLLHRPGRRRLLRRPGRPAARLLRRRRPERAGGAVAGRRRRRRPLHGGLLRALAGADRQRPGRGAAGDQARLDRQRRPGQARPRRLGPVRPVRGVGGSGRDPWRGRDVSRPRPAPPRRAARRAARRRR